MLEHDVDKLRAVLLKCHSLVCNLTDGGATLEVQIRAMCEDERSFKELAKLKSEIHISLAKIEDEFPRL